MKATTVASRYDEFQTEAVHSIVADFSEKPAGRFLLVIPTGGGKTFTAVKAVNQLYAKSVLDPEADMVLWVAHRDELLTQAEDTFARFRMLYLDAPSYADRVRFSMISKAASTLESDPTIKLIVIDEAHHGAAASYQPLFAIPTVGVLGLTATPSRHDGKPLDFERESYSIGFPDLVEHGVILRPQVRPVTGGQFDIEDLDDPDQLEALNNRERNAKIVSALLAAPDDYKKVVIYVGTKQHAVDLCDALRLSPLKDLYEDINFVVGDYNSRRTDRKSFLKAERMLGRSILVNVQVLSEGYDDPSINTVIMAAPTRSKLVYMQAIGRAIRHDPTDDLKRAYILEVVDDLPNIRYRIDNRWLYSDVSDRLEPAVIDAEYADADSFRHQLLSLYDEYDVDAALRVVPDPTEHVRYSLLLFKYYAAPGRYRHVPLFLDNTNRLQACNFFNFLSERMSRFVSMGVNRRQALEMAGLRRLPVPPTDAVGGLIYDAMSNCVKPDLSVAMPWITFVSFHLRRRPDALPGELLVFLRDVINASSLSETILRKEYVPGSVLVKFPLPLAGFIGRILHEQEFAAVAESLSALEAILAEHPNADHRNNVRLLLARLTLAIPFQDVETLPTIVRQQIDYFRPLS
jgi:superfamily II DNA or RNA helicase